jgi:glycine/D-amino acid oxidase-like deaminating enzyme
VVALIERCIELGLLLYTSTPALEVTASSTRKWKIKSSRGHIHCDRIIHATNGYASFLAPELSEKLVPLRGHAVAIDPPPSYLKTPLSHSYAFHWDDDFDYLIQRPGDGKPLIYGGGDIAHPDGFTHGVGIHDDSKVSSFVVDHLTSTVSRTFIGWEEAPARRCAWTGIMGLTEDELPFVGELPGKPGQFIAAGYNGHGEFQGPACNYLAIAN